MFGKAMGHDKKTVRGGCARQPPRTAEITWRWQLLLPGALLVTVQAQLLAPFMFINLCLAAFFQ
jgi:hypothetical protein